jgi:tetratricopeptide (TPR) repeat protein
LNIISGRAGAVSRRSGKQVTTMKSSFTGNHWKTSLRRLLACGCLLLGCCLLPAAASLAGDAGTEGPFAQGVNARAVGLGRAYTGVADDASAVYWNPGGLAYLEKKEVSSLYLPLASASDYGFLAFAYPLSRQETLAAGFMGLSVRGIPKTDAYDDDLGETSDTQFQILLAYSRVWWQNLAGGVNVKLYTHMLDSYSGTGFGADGGLFWRAAPWVPGLTLGLTLTNALPPRITLVSAADTYPLNTRLGAAYSLPLDQAGNHTVIFSADGEKSDYAGARAHAGCEYQLGKVFALRAGWDEDHPTAGAGLAYWDLRLDYAFTLKPDFGVLHYFTLGWRFGLSLDEQDMLKRKDILSELAEAKSREANRRGLEAMAQENFGHAVEEFQRALSWVETSKEISANLERAERELTAQKLQRECRQGETAYRARQFLEALALWRHVERQNPRYPGIQKMILSARQALGAVQPAAAAARSPQKAPAAELQAQELFQQGLMDYMEEKYARAVAAWEKALALNPRLESAQAYLAKARSNLPQTAPSQRPAPAATATAEKSEELYRQGLQQYRQKKFAEARDLWQQAVALNPENADARRGLERIEAILKVFQEHGIEGGSR